MLLILAHSYGARLTGGGWGGSCFALTDHSFTDSDAELVCKAYFDRFKSNCKFYNFLQCFSGSGRFYSQ